MRHIPRSEEPPAGWIEQAGVNCAISSIAFGWVIQTPQQKRPAVDHLCQSGWISMLLLEWLGKECTHPAQGLTSIIAVDMHG